MGGSRESGNPSSRLRLVRGREARGQTTLDFAFGIGIFLLIVAFVFLFVPSMLDPVSEGGQEDRVLADRLATQLATGMLVTDPTDPYALNRGCTIAFFDGPDPNPYNCNFDSSRQLREQLAVSTYEDTSTYRQRVNVQLLGGDGDDPDNDPDVLCWDRDRNEVIPRSTTGKCADGGGTDVLFEIGDSPPTDSNSVIAARRAVSIENGGAEPIAASLTVRVW